MACFNRNPMARPSAAELMRHPWLLTDELENTLMTTLEDATALKDAKALSQQLAAFDDLPRSPLETVQYLA